MGELNLFSVISYPAVWS